MFQSKSVSVAKRKLLFISLLLLLLCLATGIVTLGKRGNSPANIAPAPTQSGPTVQPFLISHAPPGMPVTLSAPTSVFTSASGGTVTLLSSLSVVAGAQGVNGIKGLNLALFEFDSGGSLRSVQGWFKLFEEQSPGVAPITLLLDRRIASNSRMVLSVERVSTTSNSWNAEFGTLAKAAGVIAIGGNAPPPTVNLSAAVSYDSGSIFCLNGMRRSRALLTSAKPDKEGQRESAKINSFTCDQNQLSFAFSFSGRVVF